jgi:hypothetical protein
VDADEARVSVEHCSVLLPTRRSAVFDIQPQTAAQLQVRHCLFSRLGTADTATTRGGEEEGGAVLIRQADEREGGSPEQNSVVYKGQDNCYHDLDGYWAVGDDWQKAGWSDFRKRTRGASVGSARVVLTQPWDEGPAQQVKLLDAPRDWLAAFRPSLTLACVRENGTSTAHLVGAESVLGERLTPAALPALDEKTTTTARRILMVEPEMEDSDSPNGFYPSLDRAIPNARPGDTILIRHADELSIDPVQLSKKALGDLTIRPARGFHPILKLGETSEADTALFRVQDGKLRLENLEFRLTPTRKQFKTLTVVALAGDGLCVLRNCVVTLDRPAGETTLALACVREVGEVMKLDMPPARDRDQGPRLLLDRCFVRGEGDLLVSRASRPCELELKDSLAALAGTLVNIEVNSDSPAAREAQKVNLILDQSTTYLGGHLVRVSAGKDTRGLMPIRCKATKCLFVAAATGRALIQLDVSDTEEKLLKEKFGWEGEQNAYGGYTTLLRQNPGGEEMAPLPLGIEKWKAQPGEESSVFNAKLGSTIPADTRFGQLGPRMFAPKEALKSGVNTSSLPRPQR